MGSGGFGTEAHYRGEDGTLSGGRLPIDFAANAASLGAETIEVKSIAELEEALKQARQNPTTTVIKIETDREARVPSYESWWDVPVAEVSSIDSVSEARAEYEKHLTAERHHL